MNPFYQSNFKILLNLNPQDCKNSLQQVKSVTNKDTNHELISFQVFPDSSRQTELKQNQSHI